MSAIYSQQVKDTLYNYEQSLIDKDSIYHVSRRRRLEKIKRLRKYLQSLSSNAHSHPICDSMKLGQIFNANGEPLDLNLRQTNYKDESGTQWRMSFFQVSPKVVEIYRLYQSSAVDELKQRKGVIKLTELELHRIVKESVNKVLKELM